MLIDLQSVTQADGPMYVRIADAVCQALAEGRLAAGQKLPAMTALAKDLGVSALTVGRSYEYLANRGIVTQRQGSGTYIHSHAMSQLKHQGKRKVRNLYVSIGEPSLSMCPQQTLFITQNVLEGVMEVLGRETRQIHIHHLRKELLAGLGDDDAILVRSNVDGDPLLPGQLLSQGVRIMTAWDAEAKLPYLPGVKIDLQQSSYLACEHLLACGYKRIGFLGRKQYLDQRLSHKFSAYISVMLKAGLTINPNHIRRVDIIPGSAYSAVREVISTGDIPDAFFVDTDYKAMEAISALKAMGLCVPEDIGIASYDDLPESARFDPPLTTVHTPRLELGRQIAHMLLNWDGQIPETVTMPSHLIIRQSTCMSSGEPSTQDSNRTPLALSKA